MSNLLGSDSVLQHSQVPSSSFLVSTKNFRNDSFGKPAIGCQDENLMQKPDSALGQLFNHGDDVFQ